MVGSASVRTEPFSHFGADDTTFGAFIRVSTWAPKYRGFVGEGRDQRNRANERERVPGQSLGEVK